MRPFLAILVLFLTTLPVLALDGAEMFDDPAKEARAREIGRELRCVKCRNQSIFDSNAGIAQDMRILVRERMEAGDSDAEILRYISDRYGDYVLLKPRVASHTYVLWLTPLALMLLGAAGLWAYHRRPRVAVTETDTGLTDLDRQEAQRILAGKGS